MNVTVLVDFDNASLQTAIAVVGALGDDLRGVRLDTSEKLVDDTLADLGEGAERGVSAERPQTGHLSTVTHQACTAGP